MKKNFRKIRKNKNTRGMALLFTLGVLMMVLVVVMMYASRVKSEAKVASAHLENQSAKLLAQSLLPRIIITLNESITAQDLHLYSSGNPNRLDFDWIWKLESAGHFEFQVNPVTEGGESDFNTNTSVPFPRYKNDGNGDPEYDEESMPTWQYIHDAATGKNVIARFAFVTIPQTLRINPNALASHAHCRSLSELEDSRQSVTTTCNICKNRLGNSPSELFFREDLLSGATRKLITHRQNANSFLFTKYRDDKGYSYWSDTQGFTNSFLGAGNKDTKDDNRTNFVADAEKYLTVNTQYSLETFWSDVNNDGEKDESEYFHRFNLRRTDWDKVGVAAGEKGSAVPDGCDEHNYILAPPRQYSTTHLEEIKTATATGSNNFPTGGIAWLNNWQDGGDWNDAEKTKKQIAANLINFCSPASRPVVSDVHPKEWTKSGVEPTYTGLKRTLYLNEVYFEVAVNSNVEVTLLKTNDDGTRNFSVKVEYYLDKRIFAELVDMYYNTLGMKLSKASDTPDFSAYTVYFNGNCKIDYNKPVKNGNELNYTSTSKDISFDSLKFVRVEDAGTHGEEYLPETGDTRRGYYLYCNEPDSADGFSETVFTETFTLENSTKTEDALKEDIYSKIKLNENPEVNINHVVVRRKEVTTGMMKDKLDNKNSTFPDAADRDGDYENVDISLLQFNSKNVGTGSDLALYDSAAGRTVVLRGNFQINDPRQNLLKSDWENAHSNKEKCYAAFQENIDTENGAMNYDKVQHSLPFTYTTRVASSGGSNRPGRPSGGGGGASTGETREPNGVNFDYNGEEQDKPTVEYKKNASSLKNPEQDYEIVTDPAWMLSKGKGKGAKLSKLGNYEMSHHVSTAFIRHGTPAYNTLGELVREFSMMSPWELGAIHRGSKWRTLNIARSPEYKSDEQNFVDPDKKNGGGEYKYGDGPILDQIKMTNDIQVLGKIDLCEYSYDDVKVFTLGALFLDMPISEEGNYLLQIVNEDGTADTNYPINEEDKKRIEEDETEDYVQEFYDAIYIGMDKTPRDPGAKPPESTDFLALYNKDLSQNSFFRRSDILAFNPASAKKKTMDSEPFRFLRMPIGRNTTDAFEEQVVGRFINLTSVEQTKVKSIKALLIVQMLRDRGIVAIKKDWNNNGKTGDSLNLEASKHLQAQIQAGYRRFSDASEDKKIFASGIKLEENINANKDGVFDPGADSIVGEAKILATLIYDQNTQKWKIQRYEFVE